MPARADSETYPIEDSPFVCSESSCDDQSTYSYSYSADDEIDHESGGLLKKHPHHGRNGDWRASRGAEVIRQICGSMVGVVFTVMVLLSLAQIVHLLVGFSAAVWAGDVQNYLSKFEGSDQQWYPTSFTRDIVPKPIHSHNDYWRKVPLYDAISVGCISVEADVWHFDGNDVLYVGHDLSSLTKNRTLNSLYINPLLDILHRQNPETEFAHNTNNGIFDTDPEQTLYLYIDIKTSGIPTYNSILTHLIPLHPYLTYYNATSNSQHRGPITVLITGNAPFSEISAPPPEGVRYAFYDCPATALSDPNAPYNTTNSLMSSAQFSTVVGGRVGVELSAAQKDRVKKVVEQAHARGIGLRFWETPGWPIRRRNLVWRGLVEAGVDLLNADDIWGAAALNW